MTAIIASQATPSVDHVAVTTQLAELSHELRTPLTAVIGLSSLLGRGIHGPLNEKQAEYVTQIESSGRHLLALVNDVLDLARMDAGKLDVQLVETDVSAIITECLAMVRQLAFSKGIVIKAGQAPNLPPVMAEPLRLKQVILNLLSNAIKFTEQGEWIGIHAVRTGDGVTINVWDSGIGIASDDLERIFEPFEQVNRSLSRKEAGVGLGLPLSRKLAELQGARLTVRSSPGYGSVFSVVFPAAEPPAELATVTSILPAATPAADARVAALLREQRRITRAAHRRAGHRSRDHR